MIGTALLWVLGSEAQIYHPYPIIFVHGFATSSKCFGVKPDPDNRNRIYSSYNENGYTHGYDPHDTYGYFLNYMMPYILASPSSLTLPALSLYNIPSQKQGGFSLEV